MHVMVYIVIVLVVLALAIWLIQLLCGMLTFPYPITIILEVLAIGTAIYFIFKRAGWL